MAGYFKLLLQGDAATLSSSTPLSINASTGTVGVSTNAARADHRHQVQAGAVGSMVACTGSTATAGTGDKLARIDHVHTVTMGAVGSMVAGLNRTANAKGNSKLLAPIDHRHTISIKLNSVATAVVKFQLYKAQAEILGSTPSAGTGRIYYNSGDNHLYVYVP